MGARAGVLALSSASRTASDTTQLPGIGLKGFPLSVGLQVGEHDDLAIDVNQTVGTSVTYFIDRLGLDGIWYAIANSGALTGAAVWSTTLAAQNSSSQSFGFQIRLRWNATGTFSASIIGK